jgi:hypothetical protein
MPKAKNKVKDEQKLYDVTVERTKIEEVTIQVLATDLEDAEEAAIEAAEEDVKVARSSADKPRILMAPPTLRLLK